MRAMQIVDGDVVRSGGTATVLSGEDALKQRVEHRLFLILGEWEYDKTLGVDWFSILGEKSTIQRLKQEVKRIVEEDTEIIKVTDIQVIEKNSASRKYELIIKADSVFGQQVFGGSV